MSEQTECSAIIESFTQCKYCQYLFSYDWERIQHVLATHPHKCIYCENSEDYSDKTWHMIESHPIRCIHCKEYSAEYPTHSEQWDHIITFHKEILKK